MLSFSSLRAPRARNTTQFCAAKLIAVPQRMPQSCAAPPGVNARDWVTKESVFGELTGGHVFDCPPSVCRQLMSAECPVLEAIGSVAPFEIAVGANGRVWLDAKEERTVVLAQAAILQSQQHPSRDHDKMVQSLARNFDVV